MVFGRREFLYGAGGAAFGAPFGAWVEGARASTAVGTPTPVDAVAEPGLMSYAQSGEDVIAGFALDYLGVDEITYLDIGAYDPILINNTYYFYKKGHRGVLVEPNVAYCEKLQRVRPEDTTLVAGIGVTAEQEADYYVMSEPSWSTFSKEEAEHQERITDKKVHVQEVRKLPLLDVNEVMAEHFSGAPTFLSIDAEGLHVAILNAVDYDRFRPKVICVETLVSGTTDTIAAIPDFLREKDYVPRGGSFVNTIFVDARIL